MKYPVYAFRDVKTQFGQPYIEQNEDAAVRGFGLMMNNPDSVMKFSPGDFDLYHIGYFDTDSGLIEGLQVPEFIVNGKSVIV